jgi:hypothetical protein
MTRCLLFSAHSRDAPAQTQHDIVVERTGVRLFIGDAKFRQ